MKLRVTLSVVVSLFVLIGALGSLKSILGESLVVHANVAQELSVRPLDPAMERLFTGYVKAIISEYLPAKHAAKVEGTREAWYRVSELAQEINNQCRSHQPWQSLETSSTVPESILGDTKEDIRHFKRLIRQEMMGLESCLWSLRYRGEDSDL